jgi:ABC-type transport system involved in multi-copper enzyme maturation permease subunit
MGASLIVGLLTREGAIFVDDFFREVVLRIVAYTLVEVAFVSACFFLSMLVKSLGAAIAVNLVSMLMLNFLGQILISEEWAVDFMRFTPLGQTFLLLADVSNKNLIVSVVASVIGLIVVLGLSYMKFRKEELK